MKSPIVTCRPRTLLILLCLLAIGCAGAVSRESGHLERSPNLAAVREAGIAVAPFGQRNPEADENSAREYLDLISYEFYSNLEVSLPMTQLVSPDETTSLLATRGAKAVDQLRWVRRQLMKGELPDKEAFVNLSKLVQHRYLMLCWVDEEQRVGNEDDAQIYFDMGMRDAVRKSTFVQVRGKIEGVVVDLWEHELLWRGAEAYKSPKVHGKLEEIQAELELTRMGAAHRFARLTADF